MADKNYSYGRGYGRGHAHVHGRGHSRHRVLFGLLYRIYDDNSKSWKIKVNFRFAAKAAATLAVALWLGGSAAVYSYFKYAKKFEEISFFSVLKTPFDIGGFRKELGEYNIRQGRKFLAAKDYQRALMYLYGGIARSPENLGARADLAAFYLYSARDPKRAAEVVLEKMPLAYRKRDKDYILLGISALLANGDGVENAASLACRALNDKIITDNDVISRFFLVIKELTARGEYEKIGEICSKTVLKSPPAALRRFLANNGAAAFLNNAEPRRARELLDSADVRSGSVYVLAGALERWEDGLEISAFKMLNTLAGKTREPSPVYKALAVCHAAMGNKKKAEECKKMAALTSKNGIDAEFYDLDNERDENAYFEKFKKISEREKSPWALVRLMGSAVSKNNAKAVEECLKSAPKDLSDGTWLSVKLLEAEYNLNRGNVYEASLNLDAVKNIVQKTGNARILQICDGMETVLKISANKDSGTFLRAFYERHKSPAKGVLETAKLLKKLGKKAEAMSLVNMLLDEAPNTDTARVFKADMLLESGDYGAFAEFAADAGRIPAGLFKEFYLRKLPEDAFIFTPAEKLGKFRARTKDALAKLDAYHREIAPE